MCATSCGSGGGSPSCPSAPRWHCTYCVTLRRHRQRRRGRWRRGMWGLRPNGWPQPSPAHCTVHALPHVLKVGLVHQVVCLLEHLHNPAARQAGGGAASLRTSAPTPGAVPAAAPCPLPAAHRRAACRPSLSAASALCSTACRLSSVASHASSSSGDMLTAACTGVGSAGAGGLMGLYWRPAQQALAGGRGAAPGGARAGGRRASTGHSAPGSLRSPPAGPCPWAALSADAPSGCDETARR